MNTFNLYCKDCRTLIVTVRSPTMATEQKESFVLCVACANARMNEKMNGK